MRRFVGIDSGTAKMGFGQLFDGRYEDSVTLSYDDAVKKNKAGKKIKYNINRRPSSLKKLSRSGQYYAKKK